MSLADTVGQRTAPTPTEILDAGVSSELELKFLEAQIKDSELARHDLELRITALTDENEQSAGELRIVIAERDAALERIRALESEVVALEGGGDVVSPPRDAAAELRAERFEQLCRMKDQRIARLQEENERFRRAIGR